MSLLRPLLNQYLRLTEKPHLRNAAGPDALRRSFEAKARLFFHAPWSMQLAWDRIAGADVLRAGPRRGQADVTILYFHGGGYVFGSPRTHGAMAAALAHRAGAQAILPRYPLAPEHPFPAALDHAYEVYLACRAAGGPLVIGGDSAGGGLVLALLGRLLVEGAPLPEAVFAFSPLTDLTFSGDSFRDNAGADVALPAERAGEMAEMYLAGADPTDPLVSPLFADFTGAPPVWITAGDTEILCDDSRGIVQRMRGRGVDVTYVEEHDLPHVWPIFHNTLPEARATLNALAAWIRAQTGARAPTR
ncbi:alpha/beta hydrolase fold domain-containing protein [Tateyamaria sp. ANG-S1]|uniref:alpha/beta hydrolase fold domain-containing protein n=1 Tax=Tateyamaria sp. ANG-S1 TaxID=1577905 RepID=UPI00057FCD85|nr:alpha/beta hydrolase fold domain-containing protein [Tateyamaria sp. ANG-S1]KIC50075.1 esterase [Tateyamaria sp. ANG-S1]